MQLFAFSRCCSSILAAHFGPFSLFALSQQQAVSQWVQPMLYCAVLLSGHRRVAMASRAKLLQLSLLPSVFLGYSPSVKALRASTQMYSALRQVETTPSAPLIKRLVADIEDVMAISTKCPACCGLQSVSTSSAQKHRSALAAQSLSRGQCRCSGKLLRALRSSMPPNQRIWTPPARGR